MRLCLDTLCTDRINLGYEQLPAYDEQVGGVCELGGTLASRGDEYKRVVQQQTALAAESETCITV